MKYILIVDDSQIVLTKISNYLKENGYIVTTVKSGEDALEEIKNNTYDCIVLDILITIIDCIYFIKFKMKIIVQ